MEALEVFKDDVAKVTEEILKAEESSILVLIETRLQEAETKQQDVRYVEALQALWRLYKALEVLKNEGDFAKSAALLEEASAIFEKLGLGDLKSLATGLRYYCAAILDFQGGDFQQGSKLLTQVQSYLDNAGKFSSRFNSLMDHIKIDQLFGMGAQCIRSLEYELGRTYIEQSSQAAEKVANLYYAKDPALKNAFLGIAAYQTGFFYFSRAFRNLNSLDAQYAADTEKLQACAEEAIACFEKAGKLSKVRQSIYRITQGFLELTYAMRGLGDALYHGLEGNFFPAPWDPAPVKTRLENAKKFIALAGPEQASFLKFCSQLDDLAANLAHIRKAQKKDFGIFSGLISAVIFLIVFAGVSLLNQILNLKLEGLVLFGTSVSMGLIGGFGFGALKFRQLFPFLGKK